MVWQGVRLQIVDMMPNEKIQEKEIAPISSFEEFSVTSASMAPALDEETDPIAYFRTAVCVSCPTQQCFTFSILLLELLQVQFAPLEWFGIGPSVARLWQPSQSLCLYL